MRQFLNESFTSMKKVALGPLEEITCTAYCLPRNNGADASFCIISTWTTMPILDSLTDGQGAWWMLTCLFQYFNCFRGGFLKNYPLCHILLRQTINYWVARKCCGQRILMHRLAFSVLVQGNSCCLTTYPWNV